MTKISVIMPVYNVRRYLPETLDGIRKQDLTDLELICVDDGSTDGSLEFLQEQARHDQRIRVIPRPHTNAGSCRNAGLDAAIGDYVIFLDSDDVFAPRLLSRLWEQAERFKADFASCGYVDFPDGSRVPCLDSGVADGTFYERPRRSEDVFRLWKSWAWDKLYRTSFVRERNLRFQEQPVVNDLSFVYRSLLGADRVVALSDVLVGHRKRNGSIEANRAKNPTCLFDALTAVWQHVLNMDGAEAARAKDLFRPMAAGYAGWYLHSMDEDDAFAAVCERTAALAKAIGLQPRDLSSFGEAPERLIVEELIAGATPLGALRRSIGRMQQEKMERMKAERKRRRWPFGRG